MAYIENQTNTSYISEVVLPGSATVYHVKDTLAWSKINDLNGRLTSAMHFKGVATVAITDGSTTNPEISGYTWPTDYEAGDVVIYSSEEFVWTGSAWELLGAEGSYVVTGTTPTGSISNSLTTSTISYIAGNYTPEGSISATQNPDSGANYTPGGSVSAPSTTTDNVVGITGTPALKTVVTGYASPSTGTAITGASVSNEQLSFSTSSSFMTGLGTASTESVIGGATAVSTVAAVKTVAAPTWTGTPAKLTFTGTQKNASTSPEYVTAVSSTFTGDAL